MTEAHDPANDELTPTPPQTGRHVFTYGSLMYDDIFKGVTHCQCMRLSANLAGWRRYALKGRQYPGAMPENQRQTSIDGVLWLLVPDQAIVALDRFEGSEYARVDVVVVGADSRNYSAQVYQWLLTDQAAGQWHTDTFERLHRKTFLALHGSGNQ